MSGSATFKSNVLLRDEKGFMGIPFKRLLLAGVLGGLVYALSKFVTADWSIPLAILLAVIVLVLTSPRGGIPRWQRLVYRLRGMLMTALVDNPHSLAAQVGKLLELTPRYVVLEGSTLFAPPQLPAQHEVDWSEWVTYTQAREASVDDGLVVLGAALLHSAEGG